MGVLDNLPFDETNLSGLSERVKALPPQKAAGILRLSKKFGAPVEDVAGNYEAYLGGVSDTIDWDALKTTAPKTAEFMNDPYYMAIYRDKAKRLEEIEGGWKQWRAFKEESKNVGRSLVGAVIGNVEAFINSPQTPRDYIQTEISGASRLQPKNFEQMPMPEKQGPYKRADFLRSVVNSEFLKPGMPVTSEFGGKINENLFGDKTWGDLGFGMIGMIPQLAGQLSAFALGGPVGSFSFNAAMIGGGQYLDLTEDKNMDPQRALTASVGNALAQAYAEQLSLNKMMKKLPKGSPAANRWKERAEATLTEGLTEFAQKFPEAAAELWANNPGLNTQQIAGLMVDDMDKIVKEGLFEGLVAAPFGFMGKSISMKMQEGAVKRLVAQIDQTRQQLAKSAIVDVSPEAATAHLETITDNKQIYVEPEPILAMYQTGVLSQEEIDNLLGATLQSVEQAIETGEMVQMSLAKYTVATTQNPDVAKALDQHIAENEEGVTISRATERRNQEDVRRTSEQVKKENEELKAETDNLLQQVKDAAPNKATRDAANEIVKAVVMRARIMSDNPAKWLRENGPKFVRGVGPVQGAKAQRANPDGSPIFFQNDYRGTHTAPTKKDGDVANPLHDITTVYPEDIYSAKAALYYGHGDRNLDAQSVRIIHSLRHNPNKKVTIYRAVPKGVEADINPGDWVTINLQYAKMHGDHALNGKYKVIKKSVYARDIYTDGNSVHEWGYDPQPEVAKEEIAAMKKRSQMYQTAAWHGTPHTFDRFTTQKIGTGEGAQAYGWGMYFSSSKKVAEWYRDNLSRPTMEVQTNGKKDDISLLPQQARKVLREGLSLQFSKEQIIKEANRKAIAARVYNQPDFENAMKTLVDWLSEPGRSVVAASGNGKLYDVSLTPDEKDFLDWDYQMIDQSAAVRDLLLKVEPSIWGDLKGEGTTGNELYNAIVSAKGSPEAASRYLFSVGVPGITYVGNDSGERSFVVFDDSHVQINAMYQSYKGSIHWKDGRAIISLFESADASTLIHETVGHYFLESLMVEGVKEDAPDWMKQDRQTVLDYVGLESWESATQEQRVEAHEKMARSAEAYFLTGKAPSIETRSMFRRFKEWLESIYKDLSELNVNITPEIRNVFDRMLASQDEIAQMEAVEGYHAKLPDAVLSSLPAHVVDRLDKQIAKVREEAENRLRGKLMENITEDRKKEIEQERRRIEDEMRQSVENDPLYSALRNMDLKLTGDEKSISNILTAKGGTPADLVDALNEKRTAMIEAKARYLYEYHGGGVEQVQIFSPDGDKDASFRVTHNAKWYKDFYAEFGKAPTLAESRQLAEDFLQDGYEDYAEIVPPDADYLAVNEAIKAAENLRDKTKGNEWQEGSPDTAAITALFYDKTANTESLADALENSLEAEMIAESLEMSSVDELIQKAKALLPAEREIKSQTDDYISAAFPDAYLDPAKIKEAAEESMHNEESTMLAAIEQQVIEEKLTGVLKAEESRKAALQRMEQARAYAKKAFEGKPLEDALKLRSYIAAVLRAKEKATKYLTEGKLEQARAAKQTELIARAMVQESLNTRREYERINKYLKRQQKSDKKTWATEEHWQQAFDLLRRFGYASKKYNGNQTESLAAYVTRMADENPDMLAIAEWLANDREPKPTKKLTLSELKDVEGAVKNIKQMARFGVNADGLLVINSEGVAITAGKMVDTAEKNVKNRQIDEMGRQKSPGKIAQFFAGLRKPSQWFLEMDGFKDFGIWAETMYYKLAEAQNHKSELQRKVVEAIDSAFESEGITKEQRYIDAHRKIFVQEWGVSVTKNTMRAVLLNMGSESNLKRLLSKEPVGYKSENPWDLQTITDGLTKHLDASEFRLAQKLWDAINLYEDYTSMVKKVTGFPLQKVEPQPISFSVKGETIHLRGGYYPLSQDARDSKQAEMNAEKKLGDFIGVMPYPQSGASKARAKGAQYAIDYDLTNIYSHIADVTHDIAFRPVMHDINKIMRQDAVKEVIRRKLGDSAYHVITKWQKTVARGRQSDVEGVGFIDGLAQFARQRAVIANLLYRPTTIIQNVANFTLYGNSVDGFSNKDAYYSFVKYGVFDYIPKAAAGQGAEIRDFVMSKSQMMRDKMDNPDYSMRELLFAADNALTNSGNEAMQVAGIKLSMTQESIVKFGGKMLAFADQMTDIPMWRGAYFKAIEDGKTEREAVKFADAVIERSTGSGRVIDTSAMQRGSPAEKLLSMFMTFLNTQYNRWATEKGIAVKEKDAIRIMTFAASQYLLFGLISAMASFKGPKEDDDLAKWFAKEVMAWPLGMIPIAGSGMKYVFDSAMGFKTFGYALSPVERSIEDMLNLAQKTVKVVHGEKPAGDLAEPAMATASFLFGYPDQFNDWFWNAYDMMNGMEPRPTDLIRRRPKRER